MAGIYIHIPFCKQACSYCDFHFSTTFSKYRDALIQSMLTEIKNESSYLEKAQLESVYFGGGTPSLLEADELQQLLGKINEHFRLSPDAEITLEANPDDISEEKLIVWKEQGINRLSIGLQSFNADDLEWMNRAHSAEESYSAVKMATDYGFSISIDLIYGLPKSDLLSLQQNLAKAITLNPDHISAYCLTIEPKTALHSWVKKGKMDVPSSDEQADQFSALVSHLKDAGYEQYEISNFAKAHKYARHNSNYWKGKHYLGIGPSAHSYNGRERRWNIANNTGYIKAIQAGSIHFEQEMLSAEDRFNEMIMTGLRTTWGVDLDKLSSIHTLTDEFKMTLDKYVSSGHVHQSDQHIKLTKTGKLQADHIAAMLFI